MALQVVPLTNEPNQVFTVQLQVDGSPLSLNLTVNYNEMAGYWLLSISDINNNLLIDSVPMICGDYPAANILGQQRYLAIGSWYIVNVSNLLVTSGSIDTGFGQGAFGIGAFGAPGQGGVDYPNNTNLGSDFQLWVGDTPTV
jgi:hypothetical protein